MRQDGPGNILPETKSFISIEIQSCHDDYPDEDACMFVVMKCGGMEKKTTQSNSHQETTKVEGRQSHTERGYLLAGNK